MNSLISVAQLGRRSRSRSIRGGRRPGEEGCSLDERERQIRAVTITKNREIRPPLGRYGDVGQRQRSGERTHAEGARDRLVARPGTSMHTSNLAEERRAESFRVPAIQLERRVELPLTGS